MRRSTLRAAGLGVTLGLLVLVMFLLAPRPTWAPPLIKIGVVNWEKTVSSYRAFQTELEELEQRRERILDFIEEEYGELQREKIERTESGAPRDPELKELYNDAFRQVQSQRKSTIKRYHRRVREAIRKEAVEQGYSLILSENEVLYAAQSYTDLTPAVINRLNEGASADADTGAFPDLQEP